MNSHLPAVSSCNQMVRYLTNVTLHLKNNRKNKRIRNLIRSVRQLETDL